MLFLALGITFGTASLLQVMAVAQSNRAVETVVVEAAKPATKTVVGKERTISHEIIRTAANLSGR